MYDFFFTLYSILAYYYIIFLFLYIIFLIKKIHDDDDKKNDLGRERYTYEYQKNHTSLLVQGDVRGADSDVSMTAFCLIAMQESRQLCAATVGVRTCPI